MKLSAYQMHVYAMLRDRGPASTMTLTRRMYPHMVRYTIPTLGGALGKLKRAGVLGYNVVLNQWFVMPNHGIPLEVRP